jgi:two-component system, OmpR family, response regulator
MRLLLAEDDDRIAESAENALTLAGFIVQRERDGEDAWHAGDVEAFDAIVLDLGLPTLDGLTILKRWRKAGRATPVLILTARGNWDERVEGIDAGADDYLTKPFRLEELVARLRAIIRRSSGHASPLIEAGQITLDTRQMRIAVGGEPVALTPQEYRLVAYLMHHRGRVVDQLELTEHLYAQDYERDSNSVEVLVGRVRRKLGPRVIATRRGFGYIIDGNES